MNDEKTPYRKVYWSVVGRKRKWDHWRTFYEEDESHVFVTKDEEEDSIMVKKLMCYINDTEENLKVALESDEQFKNACEDFIYGIENGENYGISFYACGYNGKSQQEFQQRMLLDYGLEVF